MEFEKNITKQQRKVLRVTRNQTKQKTKAHKRWLVKENSKRKKKEISKVLCQEEVTDTKHRPTTN